jgi:hypothetical protein
MLIATAHLPALHELGASEAAGHAVRTLTEGDPQEHICRVLELQGLVLLEAPGRIGSPMQVERPLASSKPCARSLIKGSAGCLSLRLLFQGDWTHGR